LLQTTIGGKIWLTGGDPVLICWGAYNMVFDETALER
jgi:hypothetical protein